jgi:hypothetical protein
MGGGTPLRHRKANACCGIPAAFSGARMGRQTATGNGFVPADAGVGARRIAASQLMLP